MCDIRQQQNYAKTTIAYAFTYQIQNRTFELRTDSRKEKHIHAHTVFWFNIFEYENIHKISLIIQMVPNGFLLVLFYSFLSPFDYCNAHSCSASKIRKHLKAKKNPESLLWFFFISALRYSSSLRSSKQHQTNIFKEKIVKITFFFLWLHFYSMNNFILLYKKNLFLS